MEREGRMEDEDKKRGKRLRIVERGSESGIWRYIKKEKEKKCLMGLSIFVFGWVCVCCFLYFQLCLIKWLCVFVCDWLRMCVCVIAWVCGLDCMCFVLRLQLCVWFCVLACDWLRVRLCVFSYMRVVLCPFVRVWLRLFVCEYLAVCFERIILQRW